MLSFTYVSKHEHQSFLLWVIRICDIYAKLQVREAVKNTLWGGVQNPAAFSHK